MSFEESDLQAALAGVPDCGYDARALGHERAGRLCAAIPIAGRVLSPL